MCCTQVKGEHPCYTILRCLQVSGSIFTEGIGSVPEQLRYPHAWIGIYWPREGRWMHSLSVYTLWYMYTKWSYSFYILRIHSATSADGRLHLNTHTPNEAGVSWLCHCPGIVWELIRKQAHTQLVRAHSATVVSARWATVNWSWRKEWNKCARAKLHWKKKKNAGME